MDDDTFVQFFAQPTNPYHRRYEALRAVFVEGRTLKEAADAFGYQPSSMRQLIHEFRQWRDSNDASAASPFFES